MCDSRVTTYIFSYLVHGLAPYDMHCYAKCSDIEEEVMKRSRTAMMEATGMSSPDSMLPSGDTPPIGMEEATDNLRAEIASTRAVIQQLKQQANVL